MKKIVLMPLVACSVLLASGYKIPETSTNSVALSGANIAHVKSADAAYDNPANMVFMTDNNHMEADLMYIGTSATKYTPTTGTEISAKAQDFIVPSLHYVSSKLGDNNARIGVSVVVPGGLSRQWKDQPAKASAEEFTLEIVEVNPTAAFSVTDKVAVAVGFRMIHSSGIVKVTPSDNPAFPVFQNMTGDSTDFGYNLALAYHPTNDIQIGVTYRSLVNLTTEGTAKLSHPTYAISGDYDVGVSIPLPATFSAAIAYTLPTSTTIELVYEKTYWSAYRNIDFNYIDPTAEAVFGNPRAKNWKDTNAYRLGITQELDSVTIMAGVVFDETPTPEETLGFESPGSNSLSVSLGGRYEISKTIDLGLSALYSMKEDRTVSNTINTNGIDGTFSNSNALLISAGLGYKF